jgi:sugar/nucleoside kinase (ribokinase family)
MSLLVTGTIGIDTVETPQGRADEVLGGSAAYFAFAAALTQPRWSAERTLRPVRLVGVVGEDFPQAYVELFGERPIDTSGLEIRSGAKTFRWHGRYLDDMNQRESVSTELNVVGEAPPAIPDSFLDSDYVFLANTHPTVQREFIGRLQSPKLIVCDTMDLWIAEFRDELLKTLGLVGGVVLNDGEARMLTGRSDLIAAGRAVLDLGPRLVVVKKGEHGAMLVTSEDVVVMPAYPSPVVKDPTGAGDSFAGGMMAYLAAVDRTDMDALKSAVARGTCTASITIEDYSLAALRRADVKVLESRLARFRSMLTFE